MPSPRSTSIGVPTSTGSPGPGVLSARTVQCAGAGPNWPWERAAVHTRRVNRASDAWSTVRALQIGSPSGLRRALTPLLGARLHRTLLAAAGVAVAYAATAWLGTAYIFPGARVSALWFPNAILLAALLLSRRR